MSKAARSVKQASPEDRKVDDVTELLSKKQQPQHGGQIKETAVVPEQQQHQQQHQQQQQHKETMKTAKSPPQTEKVSTKVTKSSPQPTKQTATKDKDIAATKHHRHHPRNHQQRALIRQFPLQLPIHFHSLTSPPIHRSLTSLLDRNHTTPLSDEHFELLTQINGRSLTRDPSTGRFVWHTASLLLPSSHFASSTWQQSTDPKAKTSALSTQLTDDECHTIHRRRWKEIMNTLLNNCPSLHKVVLSRAERLYQDMRSQWFKTVRIVCDSYAFFICDDVQCPYSPRCPADLIRPSYCRGLKTKKGLCNVIRYKWKNWRLPKDVITNSIYDEGCLARLCHATELTPITLHLRKDYRAERCTNGIMVTLADLLKLCKAKHLLQLSSSRHNFNKSLLSRLTQRQHGRSSLRLNDVCKSYDDCLSNKKFATCIDSKQLERWEKVLEADLKGTSLPSVTTTTNDTKNKTKTKSKTEAIIPSNAPKTSALASVPAIDKWLLTTWIKQQRCAVNKSEWDVRKNKDVFAKDISTTAKKMQCTFQRTALNNYCTARGHSKRVAQRLTNLHRCRDHIWATSVPWKAYFSSPSFHHSIATSATTHHLRSLPTLLTRWMEFREQALLSSLFHGLRTKARFAHGKTKTTQKSATTKTTNKVKPFPKPPNVQENFTVDKSGRKCSKLITPQALQQSKRALTHIYPQRKDWVADMFDYHTWNLGRLLPHKDDQSSTTASIINLFDNIFSAFKRKIQ